MTTIDKVSWFTGVIVALAMASTHCGGAVENATDAQRGVEDDRDAADSQDANHVHRCSYVYDATYSSSGLLSFAGVGDCDVTPPRGQCTPFVPSLAADGGAEFVCLSDGPGRFDDAATTFRF
jgi:hypothetical protein